VTKTQILLLVGLGYVLWTKRETLGGIAVAAKSQITSLTKSLTTATDKAKLEETKLKLDRLYETGQISQTEYSDGINAYLKQLAMV